MKTMQKQISLLICAAALSFSAAAQQTLTQEGFDREAEAIVAARDAGKLTELQYAKSARDLIQKYLPTDYEMHTVAEYRILQATKLQKKQITKEEYDYLTRGKYNAILAKRQKEYEQSQAELAAYEARQAEAARQREYREDQARAAEYERQAAAEKEQRAAATSMFLQNIGNAFNRAYQPQGTNCVTVPVGSSYSTRCY